MKVDTVIKIAKLGGDVWSLFSNKLPRIKWRDGVFSSDEMPDFNPEEFLVVPIQTRTIAVHGTKVSHKPKFIEKATKKVWQRDPSWFVGVEALLYLPLRGHYARCIMSPRHFRASMGTRFFEVMLASIKKREVSRFSWFEMSLKPTNLELK